MNEEKQVKKEVKVEAKKETPKKTGEKIAVIRIRGPVKLPIKINNTLDMLKLKKKNVCVIINVTPSILGMVEKVKSFVTYGQIDDETLKLLIDKKGKKSFFNLNSPRKGFGRKGIKASFKVGGALGDRKEKINDLIRRMLE